MRGVEGNDLRACGGRLGIPHGSRLGGRQFGFGSAGEGDLDQHGEPRLKPLAHPPAPAATLPQEHVFGGLLGNQVGGGNGKKLATVAGAVGGGYAGNKAQEHLQNRDTYTTTETRCSTVTDTSEKLVGYDVKYELDGKVSQVRMASDPGRQIPVTDGQLVLVDQTSN